ncbi:hypothetical protein N7447_009236 [Penicillium robsamsonii]|uniref:uncharacterized protein n=1 Tax=Penicillium robsamsonii TaxID=1792511 RepID=UPI002549AA85|nr:uncharacterized protein N7447_009236 [Penicillium robsamsonii]KAJ5817003.1 hypothetical protein N7447_009236 [Penicillium robsamsonii]
MRTDLLATGALLLGRCLVYARTVFAHFMVLAPNTVTSFILPTQLEVTNTANWTSSQWKSDIPAAKTAHIDVFALNIAVGDAANSKALPMAFSAADSLRFKLFFSFDYARNGPWSKSMVISIHHHDGKPFVSTFEGPANSDGWIKIKSETGCFFIPDWSSLGSKAAIELGTADGLFNWASWPWGDWDMNTYTDASCLDYLDGVPYMMPAFPWFYTNPPGYDKNLTTCGTIAGRKSCRSNVFLTLCKLSLQ